MAKTPQFSGHSELGVNPENSFNISSMCAKTSIAKNRANLAQSNRLKNLGQQLQTVK